MTNPNQFNQEGCFNLEFQVNVKNIQLQLSGTILLFALLFFCEYIIQVRLVASMLISGGYLKDIPSESCLLKSLINNSSRQDHTKYPGQQSVAEKHSNPILIEFLDANHVIHSYHS